MYIPLFLAVNIFLKFTYRKLNKKELSRLLFWGACKIDVKIRKLALKLKLNVNCE